MTSTQPVGTVIAVSSRAEHGFSKVPEKAIEIVAGYGVRGDAHAGEKIKHRSRVAVDPDQPNLRQVHLIGTELLEELDANGFEVDPGELGENITTKGLDLMGLGYDTLLRIGDHAVLSVTGIRNPCQQIDSFKPGLLKQLVQKEGDRTIRKAGIMSVALRGGTVQPGDAIRIELPEGPHIPLERV